MNYIITVIGPKGNGQYEPSFQDGEWILKDCPHPMEKRTPVPDWALPGILDMLHSKFGDNFYLTITPVRKD